ncbi:MAG: GNAT family N-acetyltransferase [Steroidobacteraceae bacterium]
MTLQAKVRRAGPADAAALSLIGQATFLESFAGLHTGRDILAHCERNHSVATYAGWLADERYDQWLLEAQPGDAPVGYAVLSPSELAMDESRPDDLELKRIYLLQPAQGRGYGRLLMQAAIDRARERGSRRLVLGVWSINREALAFYARLGFVKAGSRTFRIGAQDCEDHLLGLAL